MQEDTEPVGLRPPGSWLGDGMPELAAMLGPLASGLWAPLCQVIPPPLPPWWPRPFLRVQTKQCPSWKVI